MHYEESRYEIAVPGFAEGARFRMAHLTDLHNCSYSGLMPRLDQAKPDLVLCTGDIINCPAFPQMPAWDVALSFYAELVQRFPVYAIPGNHENRWKNSEDEKMRRHYRDFRAQLQEIGVEFMENRIASVEAGGTRINLAGADLPKSAFKITKRGERVMLPGEMERFLGTKPEGFTVLLAHTPNPVHDYAAWGADLVVCGHVHGGIVRLKKLGGIVGPGLQPLPPYTKGRYTVGNTTMLVSAGLGEHSIPVRIANPRQVIYADLTAANHEEAPHGV